MTTEYILKNYDQGAFSHTKKECEKIWNDNYEGSTWSEFVKESGMEPAVTNRPRAVISSLTMLIRKMHKKFNITPDAIPFSKREKQFRIEAMQEELDEYKDAVTKEDELDALVDLVVFAIGTAERQGMLTVFDEAFARVMEANMSKELGPNQKRGSFELDLVKPEGFQPADLSDLVEGL